MLHGGGEWHHLLTEPEPSAAPRVLSVLSQMLERLVARNDQLLQAVSRSHSGTSLNAFHGVRPPAITLGRYLDRIYKYAGCSPSCFVVAFIYIDRLLHKYPDSLLVSLNVHRLLITGIMVASKILDDAHYNNSFYARVGGVSNAELNRLELELLFLLDFGVTVSSRVFESYCQHLANQILISNGGVIERSLITHVTIADDATEMSVEEDAQTCTPSQPLVG